MAPVDLSLPGRFQKVLPHVHLQPLLLARESSGPVYNMGGDGLLSVEGSGREEVGEELPMGSLSLLQVPQHPLWTTIPLILCDSHSPGDICPHSQLVVVAGKEVSLEQGSPGVSTFHPRGLSFFREPWVPPL